MGSLNPFDPVPGGAVMTACNAPQQQASAPAHAAPPPPTDYDVRMVRSDADPVPISNAAQAAVPAALHILDLARTAITTDRQKQYGSPNDSFRLIAAFWTEYLGARLNSPLSGHDVAMLMALLKVARERNRPGQDNLVDLCGYAALAGQVTR